MSWSRHRPFRWVQRGRKLCRLAFRRGMVAESVCTCLRSQSGAVRSAVLCVLLGASAARASDVPLVEWVGAEGTWTDGQNWLGSEIPRASSGQGARVSNGGVAGVVQDVPPIECLEIAKGRVLVGQGAKLAVVQQIDVLDAGVLALLGGGVSATSIGLEGTLLGQGTLEGNLLNAGVFTPGRPDQPFAQMLVNGDYRQASDGVLRLQVADVTPGSLDRIVVQGKAELGGTLEIEIGPNLQLQPGAPLALLVADQLAGAFRTVMFASSATDKAFVWSCEGTTFSIACYSLGDMNLDGAVDAADSRLFALGLVDQAAYAAEVCDLTGFTVEALAIGNVNQLGGFDFDDISAFASLAGLSTAAVVAEIQALGGVVPEPSAATLVGIAVGALAARRRDELRRRPGLS
ncbi:MAG: hypothetical protein KDA44_08220 [Planctomycetales bacterium]|nr:hypothetical protein [Planctomycetales bacterium]